MSNASVLVDKFFTHPEQMIWVKVTPALIMDLNLRLPSWHGWMKLFEATWNWRHSPMTFSISLPTVLRRTIGLKALEELYNFLLGLRMITIVDFLKCEGQWPTSIQVLAMLMMTFRHSSSLKIHFKWPYDNLSGPGADKLLQLERVSLSSSFEKVGQDKIGLLLISLRMLILTWQWSVLLNVEWRAFQRSSISRHWQSSYLIDLMAGNLYLLTQLISSQVLWQPLITKTNDHTSGKSLKSDIKRKVHKRTWQGVSAKLASYIY